jgi:phage terminase large subunit-like protein
VEDHPPDWAVRTAADRKALEEGCYWDQSRGDEVVRFAHTIFKTQWSAGPFRLHEWQERFLRAIYSFRRSNGKRRYRFANLHIAKKAGKTLVVSIIVAFELLCGREPSPYVVAGACSTKNADQIFKEVKHAIQGSPFEDYVEVVPYRQTINCPDTNATFRVLSREGEHGPNATAVVMDECHAHTTDRLFNSLRLAGKDRADPITVLISTAGNNVGHWYYSLYQKSKRILAGEDLDTEWYAEVYESDPDGDPFDPAQWHKANPSPIDEDQFRRQLEADRNVSCLWLNTLQMYLNRWVRPEEHAWLDVSQFDKFTADIDEDRLRSCPAYLGCDFSSSIDPSSVSTIFYLGDRRFYIKSKAWVCQGGAEERDKTNLPKYQQFRDVEITDGTRSDDRAVLDYILDRCQRYKVVQCNYDPAAGGHVLMGLVEREGYTVAPFPATARHYNGVMREFEAAWQEGRILHDGSDWFRYCLSNVRFDVNRNGEIYPYKRRSVDKIDGAISALVGFISAVGEITNPSDGPQVFL